MRKNILGETSLYQSLGKITRIGKIVELPIVKIFLENF